jgi:hypothetical protein
MYSPLNPRPPSLHLAAIASLISWAAQCHAKASKAREVLLLLAGRRRRRSGQGGAVDPDSGTRRASGERAGGSGSGPTDGRAGAADVAACLGVADELRKELDAFSRETLEEWQVGSSRQLKPAQTHTCTQAPPPPHTHTRTNTLASTLATRGLKGSPPAASLNLRRCSLC